MVCVQTEILKTKFGILDAKNRTRKETGDAKRFYAGSYVISTNHRQSVMTDDGMGATIVSSATNYSSSSSSSSIGGGGGVVGGGCSCRCAREGGRGGLTVN